MDHRFQDLALPKGDWECQSRFDCNIGIFRKTSTGAIEPLADVHYKTDGSHHTIANLLAASKKMHELLRAVWCDANAIPHELGGVRHFNNDIFEAIQQTLDKLATNEK